MLIDFIPACPRLHPGMMVQDDSPRYGHEWVCRACGTRLYSNDQGGAELPKLGKEGSISIMYKKQRKPDGTISVVVFQPNGVVFQPDEEV
jgi:hypothetical protein